MTQQQIKLLSIRLSGGLLFDIQNFLSANQKVQAIAHLRNQGIDLGLKGAKAIVDNIQAEKVYCTHDLWPSYQGRKKPMYIVQIDPLTDVAGLTSPDQVPTTWSKKSYTVVDHTPSIDLAMTAVEAVIADIDTRINEYDKLTGEYAQIGQFGQAHTAKMKGYGFRVAGSICQNMIMLLRAVDRADKGNFVNPATSAEIKEKLGSI